MNRLLGNVTDILDRTGRGIVKTLSRASSGVSKTMSLLRKQFVFVLAAIILIVAGSLISGGAATADVSGIAQTTTSTSSQSLSLFQSNQVAYPTSVPAAQLFNDGSTQSPKAWAERALNIGDLPSACEYLTFCRWFGISSLPSPTIGLTSMSQLPTMFSIQIGQFLFTISNAIMFLMGFVILLGSWIDIADKFTYTGDYVFGYMSKNFLTGATSTGNSSIFYLLLFALAGATIAVLVYALRRNGPMKAMILTRMGWSFLALILIAFMGAQAQSNHMTLVAPGDTPSKIAVKMNSTVSTGGVASDLNIVALSVSGSNKDIGQWAPASPGWFIAALDKTMNLVSGFAVDATKIIGDIATISNSRSVTDDEGKTTVVTGISDPSTCDVYVASMREVFANTKLGGHLKGRSEIIMQYDTIASSIYFDNWRSASFGGTVSARNSWCRAAETQGGRASGDQIMISRVGGLYNEAIGKGSLKIVGNNPVAIVDANGIASNYDNADGSFVTADGSWVGADDKAKQTSALMAYNVFGPVYQNKDVSSEDDQKGNGGGATKAAYVWAMCQWTSGGNLTINPEWNGTKNADNADWGGGDKDAATAMKEGCQDAVGSGGSSEENLKKTLGYEKNSLTAFNYHEDSGFLGGLAFGLGSTSQYKNLGGSPAAMNYYLHIQGAKSGTSIFTSILPLILMIFMIKYFGGILIGGFVSEFVASSLMIVMFLTLFIIVIPLKRCYRIASTLGLTMLSAMATTALISAILGAIFALTRIFSSLFRSTIPTNIDIVNATLNGVGILVAFIVSHYLMTKLFAGNLSGVAAGANSITRSSLAPIMRGLGGAPQSPPWSPDYWRDLTGRGRSSQDASVSTDSAKGKNSDNSASAGESVFNGGAKQGDEKNPTLKKTGNKVAGALGAMGFNQLDKYSNKNGVDPKNFMRDANGAWIDKKTGQPVADNHTRSILDGQESKQQSKLNEDGTPKSMRQRMGEGFAGLVAPFVGPKSATAPTHRSEDNQVIVPDAVFDPGQQPGGPVRFQVNPDGDVSSVGAYGSGATSRTSAQANDQMGKTVSLVGDATGGAAPIVGSNLERSDAALNAAGSGLAVLAGTPIDPANNTSRVNSDGHIVMTGNNNILFAGTNSLDQRQLQQQDRQNFDSNQGALVPNIPQDDNSTNERSSDPSRNNIIPDTNSSGLARTSGITTPASVITEQGRSALEDGKKALADGGVRTPEDSNLLLTKMIQKLEHSADSIDGGQSSDILRGIATNIQHMQRSNISPLDGTPSRAVPNSYIESVNSSIEEAFANIRNDRMMDTESFQPTRGSVINSSIFDQETYGRDMPPQISSEIEDFRGWYNRSRTSGIDMTNSAEWPAERRSSMENIVNSMRETFGDNFSDDYLIAGEVQASPAKRALRKLLSMRNRRQQ